MKITQRQLRQVIREELMREMRHHSGPVRGATFHQDPVTGEYVTGGEDFEGPGGRAAHAVRRPTIKGMKSPEQLRHSPDDSFLDFDPERIPDMGDQYDPSYYEGLDDEDPVMTDFGDPNEPDPDFDYHTYGDDPDEFMDLPAGEIMNRMRR